MLGGGDGSGPFDRQNSSYFLHFVPHQRQVNPQFDCTSPGHAHFQRNCLYFLSGRIQPGLSSGPVL